MNRYEKAKAIRQSHSISVSRRIRKRSTCTGSTTSIYHSETTEQAGVSGSERAKERGRNGARHPGASNGYARFFYDANRAWHLQFYCRIHCSRTRFEGRAMGDGAVHGCGASHLAAASFLLIERPCCIPHFCRESRISIRLFSMVRKGYIDLLL